MPRIAARPCHRAFLEFDASILDVAEGGIWFTRINIRACQRNPKLRAELFMRSEAALRGYVKGTLGRLPGTGIWKDVIDPTTGKPEIVKDDFKRVVIDRETGKPKIRRRWIFPVAPLAYENEESDIWQAASVMIEDRPGQTIRADCDCLSPWWACFFYLSGLAVRVGIGVSQPKVLPEEQCPWGKNMCGKGMAHEYTLVDFGSASAVPNFLRGLTGVILDERGQGVFDGSVLGGMGEEPPPTGPSKRGPKPSFYGAGESAHVWI